MDREQLPSSVVPEHYEVCVTPDVPAMHFEGSARILVRVTTATSEIVLNAAELEIRSAVLGTNESFTGSVELDPDRQRATLRFGREIAPGSYELAIEYAGKIYEKAEGLFISRYETPEGGRYMLTTQFEAASARRFLPCWDEPARKATFSVSAIVPADQQALSNMPIEEAVPHGAGRQCVRFKKTPRMSTYLLFLGVGEFERASRTAGSTEISVVTRRGSLQKGQFALESAAKLLEYYNAYFAVAFPLPKLDMIAVPAAGGFSAMENWGAILYFEGSLLLDPGLSTESARQRIFVVVAHEMAHQWFGNLVTMAWWDDLWLNEGFASWMENKATDHFNPAWGKWLQSESARQRAMRQDSKRTTHPVVQPVSTGEQAEQAFDDITYQKGQAVVRMIEDYLGEDAFRNGVQAYMQRFAYGNTVTDQLWAELERASGKSIRAIAASFTEQAGVPLISLQSVAPAESATEISLSQGRFAVDDSANESRIWQTPVRITSLGAGGSALSLVSGSEPASISIQGLPPIKINAGHTGYYRTKYVPEAFHALAERFGQLSPADQLGLLNDSWALGEAGGTPVADYLGLTRSVSTQSHMIIWEQIVDAFLSIDSLYLGLPGQDRFRAFASARLSTMFNDVGWDPKVNEPDNMAILREDLLSALGRFGWPPLLAEARRRFEGFVTCPGSLPANVRLPTIRVVALWADAGQYDTLHELARNAGDPFEKEQLFISLAYALESSLAESTLKIAMGTEPAATTGPSMLARVAVDHPDLAWQFALDHLDELNTRLDALRRLTFVPSLTAQATSERQLKDLRRFIGEHVPTAAQAQVERFAADLEFRLKVRAMRIPQIDNWLASQNHTDH